ILQSCTAILEVYRNNALADREIITLYEANVNSSNFTVNTIGSVDYIGANVINNGKIDVLNGDTIIIKYNTKYDTSTPNYYQKSYRVTLTPTIISFNIERGTYLFNLTDNCYSGDTLWVIITDTDQNMSSTTNETLQVILTIVKSTTGDLAYDTVVLTCTEGIASAGGVSISNNASTFVGWLNIEDAAAFTTSDNKLQVPYTTEILNKKALYYYQIRLYYKDPDSVEELVDYLPFK
ncbi:MAG TPA: hypothetical protein PLM75_09905, partial [bacterium]|nr:hypothetical protein [bacterium]